MRIQFPQSVPESCMPLASVLGVSTREGGACGEARGKACGEARRQSADRSLMKEHNSSIWLRVNVDFMMQ